MLRNFLCYVCFLSLVVVNSSLFFLAMFKVLLTFLLFSAHAHYCVLGTFVFSLCSKFLSLFCFFLHMLITVFWARLFLLVFAMLHLLFLCTSFFHACLLLESCAKTPEASRFYFGMLWLFARLAGQHNLCC